MPWVQYSLDGPSVGRQFLQLAIYELMQNPKNQIAAGDSVKYIPVLGDVLIKKKVFYLDFFLLFYYHLHNLVEKYLSQHKDNRKKT